MIDVRRVRQDPDAARAALARRLDRGALDQLGAGDRSRSASPRRRGAGRAVAGRAQRTVRRSCPPQAEPSEPADDLLAALKVSGEQAHQLEADLKDVEALLDEHLLNVPNFLLAHVPGWRGSGESRRAHVG